MKKLGESKAVAPLVALAFVGSWILPTSVAAQEDNPYEYCLATCDVLTGDARAACRAECFGPTDPGAGEGDGGPPEGYPAPPMPQPGGGGGDDRPH